MFQFFLHLQYYKSKLEGKPETSGAVFDEYLVLLAKMRDDLVNELIDHVFMDVKAKSMAYRKDKWVCAKKIYMNVGIASPFRKFGVEKNDETLIRHLKKDRGPQ